MRSLQSHSGLSFSPVIHTTSRPTGAAGLIKHMSKTTAEVLFHLCIVHRSCHSKAWTWRSFVAASRKNSYLTSSKALYLVYCSPPFLHQISDCRGLYLSRKPHFQFIKFLTILIFSCPAFIYICEFLVEKLKSCNFWLIYC